MTRICFICISLRAGGTERIVTRLANTFCQEYEVSIVILHDTAPFYELDPRVQLIRFQGRDKSRSRFRFLFALSCMKHLRTSVRSVQPDVIFSFGEFISPLARVATLGLGAKFYISNRESPLRSLKGRAGIINPLTYPLANAVVTQTVLAAQLLKRRYRFSRFTVIPNPVEIPAEVPKIDNRAKRIISVGYLGGEKNQRTLLNAFARSSYRRGWHLSVVGDGPDRLSLTGLAGELGIDDQVEFLGERRDVAELLQNSRIFAFTSLSEGFPNALSEALAHGCACIAFDCVAGPAELIRDDHNGFLLPPGDDDAYARALQNLMGDDFLQQRFSELARREIARFSQDSVTLQFLDLIHNGPAAQVLCDS